MRRCCPRQRLFFSKLSSRGDARVMPADIALPNAMLRVIPRDQHNVSRKDISPNAMRVLYRLREAGFSAYLVGGAGRDLLVGGHPKDYDVATDATPEQVKQQFRNCRLMRRWL